VARVGRCGVDGADQSPAAAARVEPRLRHHLLAT
jgi:hypothetical protein